MDMEDMFDAIPFVSPKIRFHRKKINSNDIDFNGTLYRANNLIIPPPYLIRNDNNCLSDTIAYLAFCSDPSPLDLTASQNWLLSRTQKSLEIRQQISTWLSAKARYVQYVCDSDMSEDTSATTLNRRLPSPAKLFCTKGEKKEEEDEHINHYRSTHSSHQLCSYLTEKENQSWESFSKSVIEKDVWLDDPCLTAIAEIFRRRIIIYFTENNDPHIYLPSEFQEDHEPWSIGFISDHHFVPLLECNSLIRSSVEHYRVQYYLRDKQSRPQNGYVLDGSSTKISSKDVFKQFRLDELSSIKRYITLQPLMTIAPEKLACRSIYTSLIGWEMAREYHLHIATPVADFLNDLQQETARCFQVYSSTLYGNLDKLEDSLKESRKTAKRLQKKAQKVERHLEMEYLYKETYHPNSEDEDEDEDTRETKEELTNKWLYRRYNASARVDGIQTSLQHFRGCIKELKNKNQLLPSEVLEICEQVDAFCDETYSYQDLMEQLDDSDRSEPNFSSKSTTDENDGESEELSDEEMEQWIENRFEREKKKTEKLIEDGRSMLDSPWKESDAKVRLNKLHTLQKIFDATTFRRPGSLYIIFAADEPVYIGLTTNPVERFSNGHHAFTKLLAPKYRELKLRIRFFSLNINGKPLERLDNTLAQPLASTKPNAKTKKKGVPKHQSEVEHGPKLLACAEQLLICYLKPILNDESKGKKSWHGIPAPELLSELYVYFRYTDIMPDGGKGDVSQNTNSIRISTNTLNQA